MSKHWSTFLRVWVGNMKYPSNIDNRNVEAGVFFVSTFLLHSYLRLSSSAWSATAEGNNLGAAATNSSFRRRPRFSSCKRRKNKKQKVICFSPAQQEWQAARYVSGGAGKNNPQDDCCCCRRRQRLSYFSVFNQHLASQHPIALIFIDIWHQHCSLDVTVQNGNPF